jgi:hypothetical protein
LGFNPPECASRMAPFTDLGIIPAKPAGQKNPLTPTIVDVFGVAVNTTAGAQAGFDCKILQP